MASCIVLTAMAVKLLHVALDRLVFDRLQSWRKR
jgi:iron(III) transport system permease protein